MNPLFILFINTTLSPRIVELIKIGKLDGYIYAHSHLILQLKKTFSKCSIGSFKIIECNIPYNNISFNFMLTSNTFWDTIPNYYQDIYVLYNPRLLHLNIELRKKQEKPFYLIILDKNPINIQGLIFKNPIIIDELISKGFLFYIKHKFVKNTIKSFTKKNILTIRKELKIKNNEEIKRQHFISFYMYFFHRMIDLGYYN